MIAHTNRRLPVVGIVLLAFWSSLLARPAAGQKAVLLRPMAVFDGVSARPHTGWMVRVEGDSIAAVGPGLSVGGAEVIDLPRMTLLPG
ncbi:MAG: amidohydrolase family protein, partial [Gemmatimonadales bacterium]